MNEEGQKTSWSQAIEIWKDEEIDETYITDPSDEKSTAEQMFEQHIKNNPNSSRTLKEYQEVCKNYG